MATTPRTFSPLYVNTSWHSLYRQMVGMAMDRASSIRQRVPGYSEAGPPLSNAEAVALIREWHLVANTPQAAWAHLAAVAYGWNGEPSGSLRRDEAQARAPYPTDSAPDLWQWVSDIADDLDRDPSQPSARISVDRDTFTDAVFQAQVITDLKQDGIDAAFKIPLPACKDKKTGKSRVPRIPCDKNGKGPRDPMTGAELPCDKPGDCTPVIVDDPITKVGNDLGTLATIALLIGASWLLFDNQPKRRRRSRG
jgi:hypothetical protein